MIKSLWKKHGTKLIGYASAGLGCLEFIDIKTVNLIESNFGKAGHYISLGILVTSGFLTARRGHLNSATIAQTQKDS